MQHKLFIALSVASLLLTGVVSFQNLTSPTSISVFGAAISMGFGAFSMGFFCLGLAAALMLTAGMNMRSNKVSAEKQIEWQKQDDKLAKEIQSDKEKQLEAKIVTLEAALKSALAKQKKTQS